MTALTTSAQTGAWTAVGSTGTVDPQQVGLAGVFNGTRLGFAGLTGSTVIARFNVTDGVPYMPSWTVLEVGAVNTSLVDTVVATLYMVDPCTGNTSLLCSVTHQGAGPVGTCATCTFPGNSIDFSGYLYYVEVSINRTPGANPQLSTLRIR